jgi:hypothetical protein
VRAGPTRFAKKREDIVPSKTDVGVDDFTAGKRYYYIYISRISGPSWNEGGFEAQVVSNRFVLITCAHVSTTCTR